MARKLLTLLLSAALCLGITGVALAGPGDFMELAEYEKQIGKKLSFSEAPELRVMVAAGELPLVDERLPEEPLVVTPVDEVGQYGGTLYMALLSPTTWYTVTLTVYEPAVFINRTLDKLIPNLAKGWKFSEDNKTFTLYLRKGMKWSDGVPFTADDIIFWYEDVLLNEELTPAKPTEWMPGGELMKVKKIDDWTVEYQFALPNPNFMLELSIVVKKGGQGHDFAPAHALKKYHIKYNPEAEALAKEAGYDSWWQLFNYKNPAAGGGARRVGIPVLDAWVIEELLPTGATFKRNPYYWKVDTAGNQLPYINDVKATIIEDTEVRLMKVMNGEINFAPIMFEGELSKYSVLMKNREQGGYQVWLETDSARPSWSAYYFNQNYEEDPVVGKLLRNVKFRQALSLGINREEINDFLFFGKGRPAQGSASPKAPWYDPKLDEVYAQYDPQEASRMLDEIGLDKRGKDGYRLRSDGETLTLSILCMSYLKIWETVSELVKAYWEEIGVKTEVEVRADVYNLQRAGKVQISPSTLDTMSKFGFMSYKAWFFSDWCAGFWAPEWYKWWNSRDQEEPAGTEPPEEIKKVFAMGDRVISADEEELYEIGEYIMSWHAENLYVIGTVGDMPFPCTAAANMRNIDLVHDNLAGNDPAGCRLLLAEQLYFKKNNK